MRDQTKLQHVWLLRDVPAEMRRQLNLPGPDEGIDLLARTRSGEYWAIQTKFRSQRDKRVTWRELATFTTLAFKRCNNVALAVVAHTCTKPVRRPVPDTVEIGLDRWQALDRVGWNLIVGVADIRGTVPSPPSRSDLRQPRSLSQLSAAPAYGYLSFAFTLDGQSDQAIAHAEQAIRMSPHDPRNALFNVALAAAHYLAERYNEAIVCGRKAMQQRFAEKRAARLLCASSRHRLPYSPFKAPV